MMLRVLFLSLLLALCTAQPATNTSSPSIAPTNANGTTTDVDPAPSPDCNMTLYNTWLKETYDNRFPLEKPVKSTQRPIFDGLAYDLGGVKITNEFAIDLLGTKCKQYLKAIDVGLAGKHGPVPDQAIWDVMCTEYCNYNDLLREFIIKKSGCTCMDFSTKSHEIGYSRPGDWCRMNSGKILCEELGRCGVWECQLEDFSCPRQEYNTINVELRGFATATAGVCAGVVGLFNPNVIMLSAALGLLGSMFLLMS
mmetsp:Transcript_17698/g.36736  ORF Transcript_17698/g.36736 Transcript_17698/m.36736 type:complete len:253 (+) Transcript_17698:197-955(+)